MNETTKMTDKVNATMECLSKELKLYVEFVKASITNEFLPRALCALMPLETTRPFTIPSADRKGAIKRLGFQLMRMDVVPPIFNLGLTIDLEENVAGSRKYVIYVIACKTIEEIRDFIYSSDFAPEAMEQFCRAIAVYYDCLSGVGSDRYVPYFTA